ncbi:hypothetical protein MBLNU230_g0613t1 [Neophaeotheca triangularis]
MCGIIQLFRLKGRKRNKTNTGNPPSEPEASTTSPVPTTTIPEPEEAEDTNPLFLRKLPAELRLLIYELAFQNETDHGVFHHETATFKEPALLRTCTQIRNEAEPLFYKAITHSLVFARSPECRQRRRSWMRSVGARRAALIGSLQLYVSPDAVLSMLLDMSTSFQRLTTGRELCEVDLLFCRQLLDELAEAGFDVERLTFVPYLAVEKRTPGDERRFEAWKGNMLEARAWRRHEVRFMEMIYASSK